MNNCDICGKKLTGEEEHKNQNKILCDDCYIDLTLEKDRKAPYLECPHSFMLRLKPGFDNRRLIETEDE